MDFWASSPDLQLKKPYDQQCRFSQKNHITSEKSQFTFHY